MRSSMAVFAARRLTNGHSLWLASLSVKLPRPPPRPPLGKGYGIGRLLERLVANRQFLETRPLPPFLLVLAHTCQRAVVAVVGICQGPGQPRGSAGGWARDQRTP